VVILDEGTIDNSCYIKTVLLVAWQYGNHVFGDNWISHQDGAKPHQHHLTQQRCSDTFPAFMHKDHWTTNSPDLNPLDYCIGDELTNAIDWSKVQSKTKLI